MEKRVEDAGGSTRVRSPRMENDEGEERQMDRLR